MKTISHIIKEKEKYCIVCNDVHIVPTVALTETSIYKGTEITYPSIYDYCSHTKELIANDQYQRSNANEQIKAYNLRTAQHA